MSAQEQDVFILGTGFCGSTLLGNALNGHPEIAYAGEISRLPFFGRGEPFEGCFLCMAKGQPYPTLDGDALGRIEEAGVRGAMAVLRKTYGVPIVVDGSKSGIWFDDLLAASAIGRNSRVLLTVRNPFAYVHSARKNSSIEVSKAARIWRNGIFSLLRTLHRNDIPYLLIRYEDFAFEPRPVLERVCDFLGVPFAPEMLRFWETPIHAIGGNPGAYVWYGFDDIKHLFPTQEWQEGGREYSKRRFGGWVDDKWVRNLTDGEIRAVAKLPGVVDMAAMLGYRVPVLLGKRYGNRPLPFEVLPGSFRGIRGPLGKSARILWSIGKSAFGRLRPGG